MQDTVILAMVFVAGFLVGLGAAFLLRVIQSKTSDNLAKQTQSAMEAMVQELKSSFDSLSREALRRSNEEFLTLAKTRLDTDRQLTAKELDVRKELIDQQLKIMNRELDNLSNLVKELEKDRAAKFGELARQLKSAQEQTQALLQTTSSLREALSSSKARGQWGERMAEDVLRLAGFVENINYLKQKAMDGARARPDYTFLLPRGFKLNMDVKFPLDNYLRYLQAGSDMERAKYRNDFLRDVRARIKEITTRDYIDPANNTLDYVLLFIPNEQVYAFIHEQDSSILDESIKHKVVPCSPLTLFAVLSVIRQAVDNFTLEQTSTEILSLLGSFRKQWDQFLKKLEVLGKRINDAQKEYESLVTTRRRQLERPLNRIEEIRRARSISLPAQGDSGKNTQEE